MNKRPIKIDQIMGILILGRALFYNRASNFMQTYVFNNFSYFYQYYFIKMSDF